MAEVSTVTMATAADVVNITIEGQLVPLPASIAASDDLIRKALAPFYPDIANAEIKREQTDAATAITVIKRAGPKG